MFKNEFNSIYVAVKDFILESKTLQEFIQNYVNFNLLELNIENDEFFLLKEKLKEYEIHQEHLARYFNTTQATVSRFINNKSKSSELYSKIFETELTLDELIEKVKDKEYYGY